MAEVYATAVDGDRVEELTNSGPCALYSSASLRARLGYLYLKSNTKRRTPGACRYRSKIEFGKWEGGICPHSRQRVAFKRAVVMDWASQEALEGLDLHSCAAGMLGR